MAATDTIGNVTTIYLNSKDNLQNEYKTNITGKNFTVNQSATYQQVDTMSRALNNLTNNIYDDTILVTEISVTEKIVED